MPAEPIQPPEVRPGPPPRGLLVLHGNRLETLHELLLECQRRWPLAPLRSELVLVQSNGAGEWFKAAQAQALGISAATRVDLPSRFVWQTCRNVLGAAELGARSPLDRQALVWRVLRVLPGVAGTAGFEAIEAFLADGDPLRMLQLAQRLADLYDQYQVYRADWLEAWSRGDDVLFDALGRRRELPAGQRWQALLWRELLDGLGPQARLLVRPQVQQRVLERLREASPGSLELPERVSLFGAATLAPAVLELLVALSRHAQVLVAVPNPCRFHWADIIEGRELLRAPRRRQPLRGGRELDGVPLQAMHAHAHPLLAAWGRQGRDFMRQLETHDPTRDLAEQQGELPRTDAFDESEPRSLLEHVQAAIRDLLPLAEHAAPPIPDDDDSIQFHIAHGALREVEALHDRLLELLARDAGKPEALRPRDVVVMVPDIEVFAPAVRAVFGQYAADDARRIPFDIADLRRRSGSSLLLALDWVLGIARHRVAFSEVCDLLEVPGIAARFGIDPDGRALLLRWMAESGARWGLHARQRDSLGLQACGEQGSWAHALRRMLLGYANGDAPAWRGTEPMGELGGLDAALAGSLHALLEVLQDWWNRSRESATPGRWAQAARDLLEALVLASDESERQALAAMHDGLAQWLQDCECAGFEQALPLEVFAQAWLARIDDTSVAGRFLAGGVTFCSLLPLRAIPFRVVCLLGMNEDAYPRTAQRSDFDLMALAGQYRPGDRSRRDDDRYLMLEALLSARRVFYLSWCGRSARDNTELAPSVLVSQLRDYLAAGFGAAHPGPGETPAQALLKQRTTEHALQPFGRRYFEPGGPRSYAREWFALHAPRTEAAARVSGAAAPASDGAAPSATLADLAGLLRNPARLYLRSALGVVFDQGDELPDDDEVFELDGLQRSRLLQELLRDPQQLLHEDADALLSARLLRAAAAGRLPLGGPGARVAEQLERELAPPLRCWGALAAQHARELPRLALRLDLDGRDVAGGTELPPALDDWIDGLRQRGGDAAALRLDLGASRLLQGRQLRVERLLPTWLRMLGASAAGLDCEGYLLGPDVALHWQAVEREAARAHLARLLSTWRQARAVPLPCAARTAVEHLRGGAARRVYEGSRHARGEAEDPSLARLYPDFDALCADGRFEDLAQRLFQPILDWTQASVRVLDPAELEHGARR
ncbi:exodeoxyribonuclease V subunit gamma [Thiomonas sp.]|uniref:exodeoxyribonuclease V subunit gamma n=1 Tax=Thiomonas sp. TaxID=2047785 RepID=UPI0026252720|nr:exodeoxyribonuclease V subunit gamma [Thiomonas sp.]